MTWPQFQLREIAESIDYGVSESAVDWPVGPKFLRITDIQDDQVNWNLVPYCGAPEQKLRAARLRKGDIVFARTGATTGKSFLIRECPDDTIFASYLIRVRAAPSVEPAFLAHFFRSETYWQQISATAVGAAQPGINATKLGQLEIPLPPLEEQKRIAAILDQADELRRKRRRALDRLNQLGQAIFFQMFGDLLLSLDKAVALGEVCDVRDGTHDSPKYADVGFPLLTSKNFSSGSIDYNGANFISESDFISINKRSKVDKGDIIMPMIGTIGGPVIVDFDPDFAIKNVALIKFKNSTMNREFIREVLDGELFKSHVASAGRGGTQKFVSLGDIRGFKIPFPTIDLQNLFASRVSAVRKDRARYAEAQERNETLFASLQYQAFRGGLTASSLKEAAA